MPSVAGSLAATDDLARLRLDRSGRLIIPNPGGTAMSLLLRLLGALRGHGDSPVGAAALCTQALGELNAGRRDAAAVLLRRAARLVAPDSEDALRVALLLTAAGEYAQSLTLLRARPFASLTPEAAEACVRMLLAGGDVDAAASYAREGIRVHALQATAWLVHALASEAAGHYEDALAAAQRAQALAPDSLEARTRAGIALQYLGRDDAAVAALETVLAAEPNYALARFHLALLRLARRDYAGWSDYEAREAARLAPRHAHLPRWAGRADEAVLAVGEQGLGDEIMFASCVPDLAAHAGRCAFECSPRLVRLFARSFPGVEVLGAGTPLPAAIDAVVPLGSLPQWFRPGSDAFPRHAGYLRADPDRVAHWRERLDALGAGLKVGVSWRGGTRASRTATRSLPLVDWRPLLDVKGVHWVSLQYGENVTAEIATACERTGVPVAHWQEAITDYDETAALVSALDLTISVCTSVVHLAGALGRPVWVLAPAVPEWRYGLRGAHMDWYPSARVFRQTSAGDWTQVLASAASELGSGRVVHSDAHLS